MNSGLEKIKVFLLGALTAVGLVLLTGAGGSSQIGRYQMSGALNYVHIIDTATGQWKTYEYVPNQSEPSFRASGSF